VGRGTANDGHAVSAPTEVERAFLLSRPPVLARVATVGAAGEPRVVPTGWTWDDDAGELVLGGRDLLRTARAGHIRRTGVAAVTIDGVDTSDGWAPWALLARGPARVDEDAEVIRIRPTWTRSWGL
jgi:pyridoxamine 5'-phosphate oxidase family protein